MSARAVAFAAIVAVAGSACGSKEDATLSVYTQNVTLTRSDGPFGPGTVLGGQVDLVLDMGAYSSGTVTVDRPGLRLFRDGINILARADFEPADATVSFPLTLAAKDKKVVTFTITIQQMTSEESTELCAGPVTVSGVVTEEGNTTPVSIASTPVTPTGC